MAEYERPSFNKDWWSEVEKYLREHPEEGFSEDEVKNFIKYAVNRYMNRENDTVTRGELEKVIEELRSE